MTNRAIPSAALALLLAACAGGSLETPVPTCVSGCEDPPAEQVLGEIEWYAPSGQAGGRMVVSGEDLDRMMDARRPTRPAQFHVALDSAGAVTEVRVAESSGDRRHDRALANTLADAVFADLRPGWYRVRQQSR